MDIFFETFYGGLYKLFFGSGIHLFFIIEIMFRTAFMYLYTVVNVRLMDTRSMGLLSPFEIVIIIALGSAVGDPMLHRDVPMFPAMLVISTVVFMEHFLGKLFMRSPFWDRLMNGKPVLIIKKGLLLKEAMARQNISKEELYSMLRLRGVLRISDVEHAYLEPSGSISVIRKDTSVEPEMIPNHVK